MLLHFDSICKDGAAINCISVQHRREIIPSGSYDRLVYTQITKPSRYSMSNCRTVTCYVLAATSTAHFTVSYYGRQHNKAQTTPETGSTGFKQIG